MTQRRRRRCCCAGPTARSACWRGPDGLLSGWPRPGTQSSTGSGEMLAQRIYGLALGYEDLNDHEQLRRDPLLAVLGRQARTGMNRWPARARSNRHGVDAGGGRRSLSQDQLLGRAALDTLLVDIFLEVARDARQPRSCSIWTSPTPRCTASRKSASSTATTTSTAICRCTSSAASICCAPASAASNQDASAGALAEVKRIVTPDSRSAGREVRIILRADSGFCREELMAWCEAEPRRTMFWAWRATRGCSARSSRRDGRGPATNTRRRGKPPASSREFSYQTRSSWSCARRVVAKAEYLDKGANPRFVVTSLSPTEWEARALYEQLYCARGEMENRIKEQLSLFADRMSAATLRANQLRLYLSSLAYVLLHALRRLGLGGHRVGAGPGEHHPTAAAQDCRRGAPQRPPYLSALSPRISLESAVRRGLARLCAVEGSAAVVPTSGGRQLRSPRAQKMSPPATASAITRAPLPLTTPCRLHRSLSAAPSDPWLSY